MTENEDPASRAAAFSTPVRHSSSFSFASRRSFSAATTHRRLTSVEKENHNRLHLRKPSLTVSSTSSPAALGGGETSGEAAAPHTAPPPGSSKLLRKLLRTSDRRRLLQTGPVRLHPSSPVVVAKPATTTPKRAKQQLASVAPMMTEDKEECEPRIGSTNKTPRSSRELLKSTNSSRNHRIRSLRLFDHNNNNNGHSPAPPSPLMDKNAMIETSSTDPATDIARSISSSTKNHAFVVPPLRTTGTTVSTPMTMATDDNRDDISMDDDLEEEDLTTSGAGAALLHPVSARKDCTNPMSQTLWNQPEERAGGTPNTTTVCTSPVSSCESPASVRAMSPPPAIMRPRPTRMLPPRASS